MKVDIVVHTFSKPITNQDGKQEGVPGSLTICSDTAELEHLDVSPSPRTADDGLVGSQEYASMIFMRGHQPAECLTRLGAMFNIDPLFFQRHLEYRWSSRPLKLFSSPSLPSASSNTVRLRIVTLGERGESTGLGSESHIQNLREQDEDTMNEYLHDLTREFKLQAGNSVVRAFNVHNARYFSIEQEVTATIQVMNKNWLVLIWTDIGQDLSQGPEGPWRRERFRSYTRKPTFFSHHQSLPRKSSFLPTVQYLPHKAMNKLSDYKIPVASQVQGAFAQSASLLAENYGRTLDRSLVIENPFYSLAELFQMSANSICQALNLIESIINENTGYNLVKSESYSVVSLSYHLDILNRFEKRLRENIFDLEQHQSIHQELPCDKEDETTIKGRKTVAKAVKLLRTDFKKLLFRTESLSDRCQSGVSICMNSAAIAESKRAIVQAEQVGQLTRLAFIYIPLSFTTSFFGMNVNVFGSGTLHLWIWFAASAPLVLLSYGLLAVLNGKWSY